MSAPNTAHIQWEMLNDFEFVCLSADLLRSLRFTDVSIQGHGPDGGLDLIATETLSFAVEGSRSFRWGVQCKFSKSGTKKSVGDSEIRDVEGVLRSDRYASHELRGYMVMTNRRMTQNVVERLRGIDRASPYRTCCLDGVRFQQLLADHPQLVKKYFYLQHAIRLGTPLIIQAARILPTEGPIYTYPVSFIAGNLRSARIEALLDTAASMSLVHSDILITLMSEPIGGRVITTGMSDSFAVKTHLVDIQIGQATLKGIVVCAVSELTVACVLGQDVLSKMVLLFDGPNGILKIWQ